MIEAKLGRKERQERRGQEKIKRELSKGPNLIEMMLITKRRREQQWGGEEGDRMYKSRW